MNRIAKLDSQFKCSVTVVIPHFNASKTLFRAIDSILNQSLLPESIVLVDDCSTDLGQTSESLESLISKVEDQGIGIRSIKTERNVGPGEARNAGIHQARTTYIAFLDSDDTWNPDKLLYQYQFMEQNASVFLSCHLAELFDTERTAGCKVKSEFDGFGNVKLGFKDLLYSNSIITSSVMVRNDPTLFFLGRNEAPVEDWELWLRLSENRQIVKLGMSLMTRYNYWFGESGLSQDIDLHHRAIISTYKANYKRRKINTFTFFLLCTYELFKHYRRLLISYRLRR